MSNSIFESAQCDLCDDTGHLTAYSKCHPLAPLRVELLGDGVAILFCYIPECNREVARFKAESYVEGEWKCGECGMRLHSRTIDGEMNVGIPQEETIPDCMNGHGRMQRMTWKDSALEIGITAEYWMKRAKALEAAWPEGFALPGSDEEEGLIQ